MSKFLVLFVVLAVVGCSDSESRKEDKERQDRRDREMEQITKDQQRQEAQDAQNQRQVDEDRSPPEPEKPPEPQYEETEWYYFTSATEKTPVKCLEREVETCGERFTKCSNDNTYSCQTNVKYFTKTERTLVQN